MMGSTHNGSSFNAYFILIVHLISNCNGGHMGNHNDKQLQREYL